jgi:hypothetical protein
MLTGTNISGPECTVVERISKGCEENLENAFQAVETSY